MHAAAWQALHALTLADPTLCAPAEDPIAFVRSLAPYVKVRCLMVTACAFHSRCTTLQSANCRMSVSLVPRSRSVVWYETCFLFWQPTMLTQICTAKQSPDSGPASTDVKRRQAECSLCILSVLEAVLPQLSHLERWAAFVQGQLAPHSVCVTQRT